MSKELSLVEKLKAAAAAKYNVQVLEVVETPLQVVKDTTRKVLARITMSAAVAIVMSNELPEGTDVDKTAQKLVLSAKRNITEISKGLQETATAGKDVDLTNLETFQMSECKVEHVTVELAPLYKGAIITIDFAGITDEAKTKLHGIGINATEPFAVLTALTFDKSANNVFAKVGGADLSKGTVRLSIKFVNIVNEINEPPTVANYYAKIDELTSLIEAATLKLSAKQFKYVADKLAELKNNAEIIALFGEGYNAEIIQHIANVIAVIASPETK
jgi:hypothetical protein